MTAAAFFFWKRREYSLGIDGTARGWIGGGPFGGDGDSAVSSVAELIGDTIATGKTPGYRPEKPTEEPVERYCNVQWRSERLVFVTRVQRRTRAAKSTQ